MGGSVKAAAPDPRLIEAQIESLGQQNMIGNRTLENAKDLAGVQRETLKFGLESNKQAYEQTQQDREYALGKRGQYDEALGGILNENDRFDEAVRRQELGQQAKADISSQFGEAQGQMQRGLQRSGVDPRSGKAVMAMQEGELAEAAARSRAGFMVADAAKKEGLDLRGQSVALLAGAPAQAASLTPSGASYGVAGLDVVNRAGMGMNAGYNQAASAAAQYGGMAGDMWSSQNKLHMQSQNDNRARTSEMVGTVAGMAAAGVGAKYGKEIRGFMGGGNKGFVPSPTSGGIWGG